MLDSTFCIKDMLDIKRFLILLYSFYMNMLGDASANQIIQFTLFLFHFYEKILTFLYALSS